MLTQAFAHALWRFLVQPHAWDKTPHTPDADAVDPAPAAKARLDADGYAP